MDGATRNGIGSQPATLPSVFGYRDFRLYVRDACEVRKRASRAFSLRYVALKVGMDPGSLSRVIKGQRALDPRNAGPLAKVIGLEGMERDYFETLVLFCQAKSQTEKTQFLEKLLRLSGTKVSTLEERQYEYYKQWYHTAIRELLNFFPFHGDYARLGRMLKPSLSAQDAKRAVELLRTLGLIEGREEEGFRLTEKLITSGPEIRAAVADHQQNAMGELALGALKAFKPEERSFSGLTLTLSPKGLENARAKLRVFRKELLELAREDSDVNRVYQMNFQVFPLSRAYLGGES